MHDRSRSLINKLLREKRRAMVPADGQLERLKRPEAAAVSKRIVLEELEQRLLLSADLNPVAGAIDVPGETDLYVFTLDKQQTVYFDTQTSVPGLTWSLKGPSGTQVTDRPLSTTDTTSAPPVLTLGSGDYTLSVSGVGTVTGSYRFHLLDLANATPIQNDSPVVGQLFPGSSSNLYSFNATAGAHVFLGRTSGGAA